MGQKNTTFIDKESNLNKPKNQRAKPSEFQTSIPHHHYTSSESTHHNSHLGTAERYINMRSQMMINQNDHQLQIPFTGNTISGVSHADIMHQWHNKQANEIHKNMPYRYQYGTPTSSSNNSIYRKINNQVDTYSVQQPNSTSNIDHKKKKIIY